MYKYMYKYHIRKRKRTTQTDLATTTGENTNNNDNNNIWVRNILSTPLTKAQEKILLRGPNFAIVPKSPPVGKYIASIENACSQLDKERWKN